MFDTLPAHEKANSSLAWGQLCCAQGSVHAAMKKVGAAQCRAIQNMQHHVAVNHDFSLLSTDCLVAQKYLDAPVHAHAPP